MKKNSVIYCCLLIAVLLFVLALLETTTPDNGENSGTQTSGRGGNFTTEAANVTEGIIEDEQSSSSVVVGVLIAVFGSLAAGLGDCCVKLGHHLMEAEREESGGTLNLLSRGRAVFGFGWSCAIIINTFCTLIAFAYAGAAVVMPISGLHIAATVVLAWPINGERLLPSTVCIVAMLCFGVIIIVLASEKESPDYDLDQLYNRFSNAPEAVIVLFFTALVVMVCLVLHYYVLDQGPRHTIKRTLALSLTSGFAGTITNVLAVSVVQLVGQADSWSSGFFWGLVLSLAASAVIQITTLNTALRRYNTSLVVPVVNSTLVGVGTLVATIVYAEYKAMDDIQLCTMAFGLTLIVIGIAFLSDPQPVSSKELSLTDSLSDPTEEQDTLSDSKEKPAEKTRWRMCPLLATRPEPERPDQE